MPSARSSLTISSFRFDASLQRPSRRSRSVSSCQWLPIIDRIIKKHFHPITSLVEAVRRFIQELFFNGRLLQSQGALLLKEG
jgi:hypothetical protein